MSKLKMNDDLMSNIYEHSKSTEIQSKAKELLIDHNLAKQPDEDQLNP